MNNAEAVNKKTLFVGCELWTEMSMCFWLVFVFLVDRSGWELINIWQRATHCAKGRKTKSLTRIQASTWCPGQAWGPARLVSQGTATELSFSHWHQKVVAGGDQLTNSCHG